MPIHRHRKRRMNTCLAASTQLCSVADMSNVFTANQDQVLQQTRSEIALQPPSMYEVVLLNDDYTPMDFVIDVLQRFFKKTPEDAEEITMKVHHQGQGLCGIFPKDLAESKALQVESYSRTHNHPLQCLAERSDN